MSSLGNYIRETQAEMKHVAWPARKTVTMFTVLVIFISVFVSVYLGVFDFLFHLGLEKLLTK